MTYQPKEKVDIGVFGEYRDFSEDLERNHKERNEDGTYKETPFDIIKDFFDECLKIAKNEPVIWKQSIHVATGVTKDQVHIWIKKYPEFRRIWQQVTNILVERAASYSASDKVNSTFVIFGLKANYGWKDRIDVTSDDKAIEGVINIAPAKPAQDSEEVNS